MKTRDVTSPDAGTDANRAEGRSVVVVIGIDRYRAWPGLDNAVSDARGMLDALLQLGFEQVVAPIFNEAATAETLRRLVSDDLATLEPETSLILFFAGHGTSRTRVLQTGPVQTGYIIPMDAGCAETDAARWIRIDSWLSDIARLPARHILVIIDACHCGVALNSRVRWRGAGAASAIELEPLRRRQSRRVITSALGDQRALDQGPVPGHSLFAAALIEALCGGLARSGRVEVTGSELGLHVQQRVASFTQAGQTPDFGAFELDDRGELVISLAPVASPPQAYAAPRVESGAGEPSRSAQMAGSEAPLARKRVALLDRRLVADLAAVFARHGRRLLSGYGSRSTLYALALYQEVLVESNLGSIMCRLTHADELLRDAIAILPHDLAEESPALAALAAEIGTAWLRDPAGHLEASRYARTNGSTTLHVPEMIAYLQQMLLLARQFDAAIVPHPDRWPLFRQWFGGSAVEDGRAGAIVNLPAPSHVAAGVSERRFQLVAAVHGASAAAPLARLARCEPVVYPAPASFTRSPRAAALAAHAPFVFEFCITDRSETWR